MSTMTEEKAPLAEEPIVAGRRVWVRRHPAASTAIVLVAAAGVAFAAVTTTQTLQLASAKATHQHIEKQLTAAIKSNATVTSAANKDDALAASLHDDAAAATAGADGLVDPSTLPALTAYLATLPPIIAHRPTPVVVTGYVTPTTTEEYLDQTAAMRTELAQDFHATKNTTTQLHQVDAALLAGTEPLTKTLASIAGVAPGILAANPLADPTTSTAYSDQVASIAKLTTGTYPPSVARVDTLRKALSAYASAAKLLTASQATNAAAAAAVAAAASGGSTGHTTSSRPVSNANGTVSCNGVPYPSYAAAAAACSSGGSSSGGDPAPSAPTIDHTPHVVPNANWVPNFATCNGTSYATGHTSSGGVVQMNYSFPYTYTTYSTADGWGYTVYAC